MLIGHEKQKKLFANLLENKRLAGGYIFFGEEGVGKFSFAKEIARSLERGKGTLIDTLVISPAESGSIGIEEARKLQSFLWRKPVAADYRTVIIDRADRLTNQAENALLKISEEPPIYAIIIIIAANPQVLPSTLVSRLKKIYFERISSEEIERWLIGEEGADPVRAKEISRECFGKPALAKELLSRSERVVSENADDDYVQAARVEIMSLYKNKIKNVEKIKEFLKRISLMESFNTNKKLQFQAAQWKK